MSTAPKDKIRVRMYNVRFGDAILISVPDKNPTDGKVTIRHILIDVGNVLKKSGGGDDSVFKAAVDDILKELDGKPLDLYVMTHEHLDHVQGLFYCSEKDFGGKLKDKLKVQYAWLTGSAAPNYYETHPDAEIQKKKHLDAYKQIAAGLALLPAESRAPFREIMLNNDPMSTAPCVNFIRELAAEAKTSYVHRGFDTTGRHPFKEAKFEIWAPEENTADYFRKLMPMAHLGGGADAQAAAQGAMPTPPPGVDVGAFYDLVDARRDGFAENLLAIDKAANNTSVVFALEWRGLRLLFAGDAELKSWKKMNSEQALKSVDFLKVSHHGSHNGTPAEALMNTVMPPHLDRTKRKAFISTWTDTYGGIPHDETNQRLLARCVLCSMLDDMNVPYLDATFP